ncbi:FAD/NAD(P)-binding domain-containing protein [Dendrothele bispora CBS 962.96]|uniref:FAD/NAD(P)-binding domain-containing protein n=1 Tax=Dendrothele bispora (strain CBS 962.96) TaxID=1314807 RepID=A0A4S8L3I1_DENBC|nr:FAD/NAD(P)-binding domain-containing protein [Dendrothele bispora CBS 962.96]
MKLLSQASLLGLPLVVNALAYDYIIIGGGTAGLTVANRLSEDRDKQVLVIEAGPNAENLQEVFVPGLIGAGQALTTLNWAYTTVPQTHLNGRVLTINAGKTLGGSTVINSMIFPRAEKAQYDAWGILNNDSSWSWNALLPYFKKSEIFTPSKQIPTSERREESLLLLSIRLNNTRCSAACAYYTDFADRPNFTVLTNATVIRIIWTEQGRESEITASAVEYIDANNETQVVNVSHGGEVIVSAGTIGTPKILELSGVGNSSILQAAGVKPILNLPSVGENFADHVNSWVNAFTNSITNDLLLLHPTFAEQQLNLWFENRTGFYSSVSRSLDIAAPSDIFNKSEFNHILEESEEKLDYFATLLSNGNPLLARGIQAQHRLALDLYRSNKNLPLEMSLRPSFFGNTSFEDRPARTYMLTTGPMASIYEGEFEPGLDKVTDEDIENWLRGVVQSYTHEVGTMAMLPQGLGGVVDTKLRIYGLKNVRVAGM